jgi:phosphomannomutase/phosphoglucomutase
MSKKRIEKQLFGTNGVRGIIGKELTPELVLKIGQALGTLRKGRIAIGRDTRTSGKTLSYAIKAGILAKGCDVVDCGVLPTPALQYLVKQHFDAGAMITASHNPPEYNGVKIIEGDGTEMGDDETIRLEDLIINHTLSTNTWENIGREEYAPHLIEEYIQAIVDHFPGKPGSGMTVVVDPGSGPACHTTSRILTAIGCRVLTINSVPDGKFPGRLPEPSPEGLKDLADLVVSSDAAFGVAHDGDADRAVFIDENGRFVEENQEFALITHHICHEKKGVIVTPVSTSQMVEIVGKEKGCSVKYTAVGSIYVARTMISLMENGTPVVFGGEGNGGLIFPDHQFCRDGGMTAAMMVSILSQTHKSLSEQIGLLPVRELIKEKIGIADGESILEMLKTAFANDKLDLTDGIKIYRGSSWALVRASGTEPIVRIIVDAESKEIARQLFQEIQQSIDSKKEKFTG